MARNPTEKSQPIRKAPTRRLQNIKRIMSGGFRKLGTLTLFYFSGQLTLAFDAPDSTSMTLELNRDQATDLRDKLTELLEEN